MSVQWYAPLVVLVGLLLWLRGSVLGSVMGFLFFSLFGGGAALIIGGASIQPVSLFLVFLAGHLLMTSLTTRGAPLQIGVRVNLYLAFYCIYGAVTAFLLPKIFARAMTLPPMTPHKHDIYYVVELGYSKQNLTAAIYLLGTLLASVCAAAASVDSRSRRLLVRVGAAIAWLHIMFGLIGLLGNRLGASRFIDFFRNAKYAMLDQDTLGFSRVSGILPEASAYGGYAFTWFVFMTELWLRRVNPRLTGVTAAGLLVMIILCTSTSTYFGLAVYMAIMAVRWFLGARELRGSTVALVAAAGLAGLAAILTAATFTPSFAALLSRLISSLTLHKINSTSGLGRGFWARAGLEAFIKSYGLGVGAGSFRSSSLILSILGSTGVIGTVAFLAHLAKIFRPFRPQTYALRPGADGDPVGASATWAACVGLLPGMVSAPSPHPGMVFAALSGFSLGWAYLAERNRRAAYPAVRRPPPVTTSPTPAVA